MKMGSLFHMSPKCRKPLFVEGKSSPPGVSQTDGEIAFACKSSAPLHWQGRRKRGKTEARFTPWRQRAPNGQFYCFCPIRLTNIQKIQFFLILSLFISCIFLVLCYNGTINKRKILHKCKVNKYPENTIFSNFIPFHILHFSCSLL